MAQAITTQNQNVQLTKTFIVAFAGMLLAVPIVTLITASIVQAQFGSLVHAAQAPQTNSLVAGPSCEVPLEDQEQAGSQANAAKGIFAKAVKWLPFGQSNYHSTTTHTTNNTTTNTSAVTIRDNGNTDNRFSGNSFSNNQSWSNQQTWNANGNSYNSGNTTNTSVTTNTDLSNNSVNTNIQNSGNTSNTSTTTNTVNDNSVNNSNNTDVEVEVELEAELDIL